MYRLKIHTLFNVLTIDFEHGLIEQMGACSDNSEIIAGGRHIGMKLSGPQFMSCTLIIITVIIILVGADEPG